MNKVYFEKRESSVHPGKFVITPINENFNLRFTEGAFTVIMSRVLNLSYAQYLRFCRDICGAELIGKNERYVQAYFNDGLNLKALLRVLNSQAELIMWERENPNYEKHEIELAIHEAKMLLRGEDNEYK